MFGCIVEPQNHSEAPERLEERIANCTNAWREEIQAFLQAHQRITVAQFRDRVGISCNLAVHVLEHFDQEGVTKRIGDSRETRLQPTQQRTMA